MQEILLLKITQRRKPNPTNGQHKNKEKTDKALSTGKKLLLSDVKFPNIPHVTNEKENQIQQAFNTPREENHDKILSRKICKAQAGQISKMPRIFRIKSREVQT